MSVIIPTATEVSATSEPVKKTRAKGGGRKPSRYKLKTKIGVVQACVFDREENKEITEYQSREEAKTILKELRAKEKQARKEVA